MLSVHFWLLRTPFPGSGRIEPGILRSGAAPQERGHRACGRHFSEASLLFQAPYLCAASFPSPFTLQLRSPRRDTQGASPNSLFLEFPDFLRSRPQRCGWDVDKTRSGSCWTSQAPCGKAARMSDPFRFLRTGLCTGHGYVPKVAEKSNSFGIKPWRQRGGSRQPGDSDCSTAQLQSLSPAGPGVPEPPRCHQPCA